MATPEEYEQQIERGKEIVRKVLRDLAEELNEPKVARFEFIRTHDDFDTDSLSLHDPETGEPLTKFSLSLLADGQATPTCKSQLEQQVRAAVANYMKMNRKG